MIYDRKTATKVKGKKYKVEVRPTMYGLETTARRQEVELNVL